MAITEMKKGNNTYLVFTYRDGEKLVRIYCGKKGLESTEQNIKKAKQKWHDLRLVKLNEKFG